MQTQYKPRGRSAFTMIELVFILLILGILAAIAVPKISASRDDAKVVATAADIATLQSSIPAYYLARGQVNFPEAIHLNTSNWTSVTDFQIESTLLDDDDNPCVTVKLLNGKNVSTNPKRVDTLEFVSNGQPKADGRGCQKLLSKVGFGKNSPIIIEIGAGGITN